MALLAAFSLPGETAALTGWQTTPRSTYMSYVPRRRSVLRPSDSAHPGAMDASAALSHTHITELASSRARVIFIVSGPQATDAANSLRGAILQNPRNRHSELDLVVMSLDEAAAAVENDRKFPTYSRIFLLDHEELKQAIPSALSLVLPAAPNEQEPTASTVVSQISNPADRNAGLAFTALLDAPDAERLGRLKTIFAGHSASNYRELPFSSTFHSNKVAVLTAPEDQKLAEGWGAESGPDIWNYTRWIPVNQRDSVPPQELSEYDEVYLLNRASHIEVLPDPAARLVGSDPVPDTTVIISQSELPNKKRVAVISAPCERILQLRARKYQRLSQFPAAPLKEQLNDFRSIKESTLKVEGAGLTSDQVESVRLGLAGAMRRFLRVPVEERGKALAGLQNEVTLETLQGATDTASAARRKTGLRYIWYLTVVDCGGNTEYQPREFRVSRPPSPPTDAEPQVPDRLTGGGLFGGRRHEKDPAVYEREMEQYREQHAGWVQARESYQEQLSSGPVQWRRQVYTTRRAHARAYWRLFDIKNPNEPARVLWETETAGERTVSPALLNQDGVTVAGFQARPPPIETPAASEECPPEVVQDALRDAGYKGLSTLATNSLLPGDTAGTSRGGSPLRSGGGTLDGLTPSSGGETLSGGGTLSGGETTGGTLASGDRRSSEGASVTKTGDGANQAASPPAASAASTRGPQVADVDADTGIITVSLTEDDGAQVGDRVDVVLESKEITDPTTGEVLKVKVLRRATLTVRKVADKYVDCMAIAADASKLSDIHVGMKVLLIKAKHQRAAASPGVKPGTTAHGRSSSRSSRRHKH